MDEYGGMSEMIAIHEDRFIEGLSRLAQAVQAEGARLFAQLYQAGRYAYFFLIGGRTPLAPFGHSQQTHRRNAQGHGPQ